MSFSAPGEDEDSAQDNYYSETYFEVRPRDRLTGLRDGIAEVVAGVVVCSTVAGRIVGYDVILHVHSGKLGGNLSRRYLSVVVVRSDEGPVDRPPIVRGVDDTDILHRGVRVLDDCRYRHYVIGSGRGWLNPWSTD
jgi:hypothetical protein